MTSLMRELMEARVVENGVPSIHQRTNPPFVKMAKRSNIFEQALLYVVTTMSMLIISNAS